MTPAARSYFLRGCLSEIARQLSQSAGAFLFLDFDGTLAPIVNNPRAAAMPPETRRQLRRLIRRPGIRVAIVSGRALTDLIPRVGLEGLICAGNHGLEISGPDFRFVEPEAERRIGTLLQVTRALDLRLRYIPGVVLENKGLTASVHYRSVREPDREDVRRTVISTVRSVGQMFFVTQGLEVLEIRPQVNWDKGKAVKLILESAGVPSAVPLYIGDDATDEDALAVLPDGITVRVGLTGETAARYRVDSQREVEEFLTWLADLPDVVWGTSD